jgi:hypothetical protein
MRADVHAVRAGLGARKRETPGLERKVGIGVAMAGAEWGRGRGALWTAAREL